MSEKFQQIPSVSGAPEVNSQVLSDAMIINKIQDRANQNNKLMNQADGLTKTLARGTLTPEQRSSLAPDQLRAIQRNDMNSIQQQLGMVKWTMSERGQQLNSSLQFFSNTLSEMRQEERQKKEDARRNIMEAMDLIGSQAFANMSEDDKRRIEREAGFEQGFLSRARTGLQEREQKAEEERQLQLESARQQMELARRSADLDDKRFGLQERQFDFQRQDAAANRSMQARQLQAQIDAARQPAPAKQWEAEAAARTAVRDNLRGIDKSYADTLRKMASSNQFLAIDQLVGRISNNENLNVGNLKPAQIREEVYGYLGINIPNSRDIRAGQVNFQAPQLGR